MVKLNSVLHYKGPPGKLSKNKYKMKGAAEKLKTSTVCAQIFPTMLATVLHFVLLYRKISCMFQQQSRYSYCWDIS